MATKSKSYWRTKIQQGITTRNAAVDVEFGTVYDVVVAPVGDVLEELSADVDSVQKIMDITRWQEWTAEEADKVAVGYGLYRRSGTKATGVVTFYAVNKPTVDVVIPRNTVVSTSNGIQFRVTTKVQVAEADVANYKNAVTGRYEFNAYVEALQAGVAGVAGAGTIIKYDSGQLQGVSSVVSKTATVGGAEEEINESLVKRILMKAQGGMGGAVGNGLRLRLLQAFDGVISSIELEESAPIVDGTVDIWYLGARLVSAEISTYWFGRDVVIGNGPVTEVTEVSSNAVVYTQGVDYILVKDTTSGFARSPQAQDKIRWLSQTKPTYGAEVTIRYIKNAFAQDIADWIARYYMQVTGLQLRYREGISESTEVAVTVVVQAGFDPDDVKDNVKTALNDYINSRKLGDNIEQADLIYTMKSVAGVDNVTITKLCLKGGSGVQDLTVPKSKYFVIVLADITVR